MSIERGGFFAVFLEALAVEGKRSLVCGEGVGRGEYGLSEKVVVEEAGEPQPKKDPSLEPPGDLGCVFCTGVELDEAGLGTFIVCGGVGLVENTDIVAELGWLVELEPLYQVPVDSVTVVRVESLVNRACFTTGASDEGFCHGAAGTLVVLGVLWSMAVTGSGVETSSVTAWRSADGLLRTLY
jgi:hypothetical protein